MEVYVEYVVIDNLIINYILILSARTTLKLTAKKRRLCLSSIIGTVVAVILPLTNLNGGFLVLIKFVLGIIMTLLSGKFKGIKSFIRCFYLFLFYTFLFGGGVYAVFTLLNIDINVWNYANDGYFPMGIIVLICCILYVFVKRAVFAFYRKRNVDNFTCKCKIDINGTVNEVTGFIDSGNTLVYKKTDSPIIVCMPSLVKKLDKSGVFNGLYSDIVSFSTASGKSFMIVYKIDKIEIYNKDKPNIISNVMLGVSKNLKHSGAEYDVILNAGLIDEIC